MKPTPRILLGALCAALLLLPAPRVAAQNAKPPTQLTYQGFLTDGSGVPFGNTAPVNKTVIFRIYDALSNGTLKWSSQQVVTVDKGYFSVLLGQGSAGPEGSAYFSADLTGVFTGAGTSDRYLELTADNTTIAPRLRFLAAPYAMLAKSATELLDPVTGASSLSVSGGNLSAANVNVSGTVTAANVGGSGANLTSLNASQITSGTLANDRTTASVSSSPNALVLRDGAGSLFGNTLSAQGPATSHGQGGWLEWNKDGSGKTYLLNQMGSGSGGIVFGEVSTANAITERMRVDGSGNVGIGKTAPTAKLDVAGTVAATSFTGNGTIPVGGIIMWSGATVPTGWALCDGGTAYGVTTPNLSDRFIVAKGASYPLNSTGGSTTYSLKSGNLPTFSLNYQDIFYSENGGSVSVASNKGSGDSDSDNKGYEMTRTATFNGSATAFSIIPPYYALAFIMRVQ